MRVLAILAAAIVFSACSDASIGAGSTPQPLVAVPTTAAPTAPPSADPTTTPRPLAIKVTKRTKSVAQNATASITIKTHIGASCSIDVEYASGSATAKGLEPKKTNSSGVITWKWKVGSNTSRGTWPISIFCELKDRSGSVSTEFAVT